MKYLNLSAVAVICLFATSCKKEIKEHTCQCYYDNDMPSVSIPLKTNDVQFAKTQCTDYASPASYNRHHCSLLEQ